MPWRPRIVPPVGKSGPGTMAMRSSMPSAGSSISARQASITSPRLCGGMLVAMPTAMPPAPLTRRFGNFAGSTTGSGAGAVDQAVAKLRRQHHWLAGGAVIIVLEVDGVLVDVVQQMQRDLGQPRLG